MTIQNAIRKSQNIQTALQCRSICGRRYARCVPGYVYSRRPKFRFCLSELQSIPLPFNDIAVYVALAMYQVSSSLCLNPHANVSLVIFNMWLIDFGCFNKTKYYLIIIIIIAEMSDFMWLATSKRDGAGQMAYH